MYPGATVLIVEDEALVALDLASAVEAAGGRVLGPAPTTTEALALIEEAGLSGEPVSAAVLDLKLLDRDVTPVVMRLLNAGIPIVVYSATGFSPDISASGADVSWMMKPAPSPEVVARLCQKMQHDLSSRVAVTCR